MWRYVTSLTCLFVALHGMAQTPAPQDPAATSKTIAIDSLTIKKKYGLRLGIDAASLLRTGFDKNYTGAQAIADFRLTDSWYAAGEIGFEEGTQRNERIDATATGAFIKVGADYNFYENWLEMDNMVYAGLRLGYANFNQELTRYAYYQDNNYFPLLPNEVNQRFNGLQAIWFEVQLGLKVEVLNNVYLGFNLQLKQQISQNQPAVFNNLYIPGFGRTFDTTNIGVGYGYGISYRIPFYKK